MYYHYTSKNLRSRAVIETPVQLWTRFTHVNYVTTTICYWLELEGIVIYEREGLGEQCYLPGSKTAAVYVTAWRELKVKYIELIYIMFNLEYSLNKTETLLGGFHSRLVGTSKKYYCGLTHGSFARKKYTLCIFRFVFLSF